GEADALREIDPSEFARIAYHEADADLPWMIAPETLVAATAPARAYTLQDRVFALIANPDAETLTLTAIVVPAAHRGQGWGKRMLRALEAAFPDKPWQAVALIPENMAPGFFEHAGWERQGISQLEMRLDLGV
ncbi:MAG TPA: GNAT family N-acetyltransferase, partial [Pseudonocardiaceae bacterium]|nr:GNAT family N-acetyltransferase [Pseudonocardiaceae bacterium]